MDNRENAKIYQKQQIMSLHKEWLDDLRKVCPFKDISDRYLYKLWSMFSDDVYSACFMQPYDCVIDQFERWIDDDYSVWSGEE